MASTPHHTKLGQLASTAICGNDITSSCLYVSALAIVYAGKLAPFVLLMVAAVLFLFRSIYAEVVGALPLNGGAYNALLNTTSKFRASIAACLTVLSYMATAVISALEATHYVHNLWDGLHILYATIGLLACFMVLTIMGITESAIVAIIIFITHMVTLTLLVIVAICFVASNGIGTLQENFDKPLPSPPTGVAQETNDALGTQTSGDTPTEIPGTLWTALFFGFSAAMLGISGFESSSNFVEEQQPGVFPKTLRNMWIAVSVFNPLIALLALAVLSGMEIDGNQNALLAYMGQVAGEGAFGKNFGSLLSKVISVDAALVLSGAVLTSFVGVTGLVHRMTLDRCLPQFLLRTNRRGTTHRIIIAFFLLCLSVLLITDINISSLTVASSTERAQQLATENPGFQPFSSEVIAANLYRNAGDYQLKKLAGIYTISFLSVMALFGLGNILLKIKRKNLPRPTQARWSSVIVAIAAVLLGLVGNAMIDHQYVITFLQYFVPAMLVIGIMLSRIALLAGLLTMLRTVTVAILSPMTTLTRWIRDKIAEINSQQIVFFTRGDNIANLNNALLYVKQNEHTNRLKIVTVTNEDVPLPATLEQEIEFLNHAYPEIDLEFVHLIDQFSPELIQRLSKEWNIPANLMFIGSPGGRLPYDLGELGGVRLII